MVKIGLDKIGALFDRVGKSRATQILKFVKTQDSLVEALNTTIGTELLTDGLNRAAVLLDQIALGEVSEEEMAVIRAEYKALRGILDVWAARIVRFNSTLDNIENGGK